jgi:hypothetical protein
LRGWAHASFYTGPVHEDDTIKSLVDSPNWHIPDVSADNQTNSLTD